MTTESKGAKLFCEVICHVEFCVHPFQANQVTLNSFAEYIVFNIHMADAGGWLSGVGHSSACIVILIYHRCGTLWDSEVPENTPTEVDHFFHSLSLQYI